MEAKRAILFPQNSVRMRLSEVFMMAGLWRRLESEKVERWAGLCGSWVPPAGVARPETVGKVMCSDNRVRRDSGLVDRLWTWGRVRWSVVPNTLVKSSPVRLAYLFIKCIVLVSCFCFRELSWSPIQSMWSPWLVNYLLCFGWIFQSRTICYRILASDVACFTCFHAVKSWSTISLWVLSYCFCLFVCFFKRSSMLSMATM